MSVMEPTNVSERLRRARRSCRLSSKVLASRLDVNPATLSRYENGRAEPPKLILYGYSVETGWPLEWLETGVIPENDSGPRNRWSSELVAA